MTTEKQIAANRRNAKMRCRPGSLLRQLYGHYVQSSVRRNIPFALTTEEFKVLVEGDCHYCGAPPSREYRPSRYTFSYLTNGVDRVQNDRGYVLENCVTCCKTCNQFKSTLTVEEMLAVIQRIYDRHIAKEF